jgi:carboxypeptidase Q
VLGVGLDETTIVDIDDDSLARRAGLRVGDRIVSLDAVALTSDDELTTAIQRGAACKTAVIERTDEHATKQRIEVSLDWSEDPDEAARAARRAERRERFGPELRPWDTEVEHD